MLLKFSFVFFLLLQQLWKKTDFSEEKNDFGNVLRRYKSDFSREKMTLVMSCSDVKTDFSEEKNDFGDVLRQYKTDFSEEKK